MSELEWMDELEERVEEAAAEIARLRDENEALQRRVATLESESGDGGDWFEQREEIRDRVEGLVDHLESLLPE